MLGRILNVLLLLPTLMLIVLFVCIYPIIGYIIGRGFSKSIEVSNNLIEELFERSALTALICLIKTIRYGRFE